MGKALWLQTDEELDFIINLRRQIPNGQKVKPVKLWLTDHTAKDKTQSIAY